MNSWLRTIFGLEEGETPAGGETFWEFSSMPQGFWLAASAILLLGSLAFICALYFRERQLGIFQRSVLALLRLGCLVLVVLILLNPRLLTEIRIDRPGKTVLLLDDSASMQEKDKLDEESFRVIARATDLDPGSQPTRSEIIVAAVEKKLAVADEEEKSSLLELLGRNNELSFFTFGSELKEVGPFVNGQAPATAQGETRIGDALVEVVKEFERDPLAGIIVLSDGRNNSGASPIRALDAISLGRRVPIFTVGVGIDKQPMNFVVQELSIPSLIEVDYPLEIDAKVLLSGIQRTVKVQLHRSRQDGRDRKLVDARTLTPKNRMLEERLRFTDRLAEKGKYRYTLSIERDQREIEWRDNLQSAEVTAASELRRVLLMAGHATNEYRFLRNLAIRDDGIQVSCWLSSADTEYPQDGDILITELPQTSEELREYDVVLMLDPQPSTVTPALQDALVDFVTEQGGGLAFVAGEINTHALARAERFRKLRALLPVELASARAPLSGRIFDKGWLPTLTARGRSYPLCRLSNEPVENLELWQRLPPFYFWYQASRLRPGGLSLLQKESDIIAATHRLGFAEVFYLGTDDFWRWRAGEVGIHERFWAAIIRQLSLGKQQAGTRRATIETDRDRYNKEEDVRVNVRLVDSRRRPVESAAVEIFIESGKKPQAEVQPQRPGESAASAGEKIRKRLTLAPVPGSPGRYSGIFRTAEAGHYQVSLGEEARSFFEIVDIYAELEDLSPDFRSLEQVAESSAGRFFTVSPELRELGDPGLIPDASVSEVLARRASTVWDSAMMMFLFTGMLVLEWILRKLWRLN